MQTPPGPGPAAGRTWAQKRTSPLRGATPPPPPLLALLCSPHPLPTGLTSSASSPARGCGSAGSRRAPARPPARRPAACSAAAAAAPPPEPPCTPPAPRPAAGEVCEWVPGLAPRPELELDPPTPRHLFPRQLFWNETLPCRRGASPRGWCTGQGEAQSSRQPGKEVIKE